MTGEVAAGPSPARGSTAPAVPAGEDSKEAREKGFGKLVIGALGVVFGDIGTSPLYTLRETFDGHHPLPVDIPHIYGVISLIFWTITLMVGLKYVTIIMRADNHGEGGEIAMQALLMRHVHGRSWAPVVAVLGILATTLFFADSIITPTISVLSAVEGITIIQPGTEPLVLPVALAILIGLYTIQSKGTGHVSVFFGPVMFVYFSTLAILGLYHIVQNPGIMAALSPHYAALFFLNEPGTAFLALSSVVLAMTGAEALYADMGHFGRLPIQISWFSLIMPALALNYLGQAALLAGSPDSVRNPFFLLAPESLRIPLIILATLATVIASQAVISGAFSVTRQAVQLGYLPRLRILHTSATTEGQIYIPFVNWAQLTLIIILVLSFRTSSNLAGAYGVSVTGTMLISSCMLATVMITVWKQPKWLTALLIIPMLCIDLAYFTANLTKFFAGGWFPLTLGFVLFLFLTTWAMGRRLLQKRLRESAMPVQIFIKSATRTAVRVPGTAVYLAANPKGVPQALLHNLKHNKVLHERVIILTVAVEEVPFVPRAERLETVNLGDGFFRVLVHYGFMQHPNLPKVLERGIDLGPPIRMMDTSFFLARQTLLASERPGMALWREKLFSWMLRNSETAMEFFHLPSNRVVELGSQIEI